MTASPSATLREAIAAETHAWGADELARGVVELAQRFTRGRGAPATPYLRDRRLARAYAAYYLPLNIAKVQALLDELPLDWLAPRPDPYEILDLGCGPGAGALAVLDRLAHREACDVRVTAVDHEPEAVALCRRLWDRASHASSHGAVLRTQVADLQREGGGAVAEPRQFDLIIVANVLDELFRGATDPISRRVPLVQALLKRLAPAGTLMLIEPALRDTARALHMVRDRVLAEGGCNVFSPCLHDRRCPALLKATDWCHEERAWDPPDLVRAIDERVGFIKDALKFSYVLLRRDGRTIVPRSPDLYRVVSELREMKGEARAWLCHETGRPEAGRLDRQRSSINDAFGSAHRGAIIRVPDLVRGERKGRDATVLRVRPDTVVEMVRGIRAKES